MSNNRQHTLVFDGNYFLYKTMYVIPKERGKKILETDSNRKIYIRKLAMDFAAEMRRFKSIVNRVVFTVDSKSWRKDFNTTYKAQRVPDSEIFWDGFYECIEIFVTILKQNNVIHHQTPGAEGDDIVYAWSKYLNLKGVNVIIVSGDKDLMQLVDNNNSTKSYTLFYTNTGKKLAAYPGYVDWLMDESDSSVTDIFNLKQTVQGDTYVKELLKNLIKKYRLNVINLDSDKFIFIKVLQGDRGDNVDSAYWYKKNDRTYRISEKKAEKIHTAFIEKHKDFKAIYLFNKDYREDIVHMIIHEMNAIHMTYQEILDNVERNITLMVLHTKTIPHEILESMFKTVEENYKLDIKPIDTLEDMNKILKGTDYEQDTYVPNQYNVFGNNSDSGLEDDIKDIFKGI